MGVIPPKMIDGTLFPSYLVDLFGRLKSSLPYQQISASLWSSARDLLVSAGRVSGTGGTVTYDPNAPVIELAVGTTAALLRARSKIPATYQPGKPLLQFITGVMGTKTNNTVQRFGYGFGQNRLYFRQDANGLAVVLESTSFGGVTTTSVFQEDWNADKLDGTGASGVTLDTEASQIYFVSFEYLGVGDIVFGIVYDRTPIICHVIANPGTITTTYMATPAGFAFWENEQLGSEGTAQTCKAICSSVQIEGSDDAIAARFTVSQPLGTTFNLGAANNYRPILFFRLQSGWQNTRVRAINIDVEISAGTYRILLCRNPVITGTYTPSWTAKTNSSVEYWVNTSNTLSVSTTNAINASIWETSGTTSNRGNSPTSTDLNSLDFIGTDFADNSDIFVICVGDSTANAIVESLIAVLEQQI